MIFYFVSGASYLNVDNCVVWMIQVRLCTPPMYLIEKAEIVFKAECVDGRDREVILERPSLSFPALVLSLLRKLNQYSDGELVSACGCDRASILEKVNAINRITGERLWFMSRKWMAIIEGEMKRAWDGEIVLVTVPGTRDPRIEANRVEDPTSHPSVVELISDLDLIAGSVFLSHGERL